MTQRRKEKQKLFKFDGVEFEKSILYPKSWTDFSKAFCAYLTYNYNNWRSNMRKMP